MKKAALKISDLVNRAAEEGSTSGYVFFLMNLLNTAKLTSVVHYLSVTVAVKSRLSEMSKSHHNLIQ